MARRSNLVHQSKRQIVGAKCVSCVGNPAANWALTGHNGLDKEAQYGEHGTTSVLDLLDLKLGESVRIVSQTKGVEGSTGQQNRILTGRASLVGTVGLSGTLQRHLTC